MRRWLFFVSAVTAFGLQLQGVSQPASSRYGLNDDLNICDLKECEAGPRAFARMRQDGFGWVRYWFYWDRTNRQPGEYDWDQSDREIKAITDAGLNIYATVMWAPAWATGGVPVYTAWYCARQGGGFDPTKPECDNPPAHPDTAALSVYLQTAMKRYPQIRHWGLWNEPSDRVMWPAGDIVATILAPGYKAIKAIDPTVVVVGPEDNNPRGLESILGQEGKYGRFLDVISVHVYESPYPAGAFKKLDQGFKPVIDQFGRGRPVWLTETGFPSASHSEFNFQQAAALRAMFDGLKARAWIEKVFFYRLKDSFGTAGYGILDLDAWPKLAWFALSDAIASEPRVADWVVRSGDFNGDGILDEFRYRTAAGAWEMRISRSVGMDLYRGNWSPGWEVRVGDFDGDSRSDLFLYNRATGQWFQCRWQGREFAYITEQWSPGWEVYVGRLDSDARTDVLVYRLDQNLSILCLSEGFGRFRYQRATV